MLLKQYFLKKLGASTISILLILSVIFAFVQLSEIMKDAINGSVSHSHVWVVLLAFLPYLFILLLPLTIILSGIIVLNNFSDSSEYVAMRSLGVSNRFILRWILNVATKLFILSFLLNSYVEPIATKYRNNIGSNFDTMTAISSFTEGQFYPMVGGDVVAYIGNVEKVGVEFKNLFFARRVTDVNGAQSWDIITAKDANKDYDPNFAHSWKLTSSNIYHFSPGKSAGTKVNVSDTTVKVIEKTLSNHTLNFNEISLRALWEHRANKLAAEVLAWRLSLPLSILVLALFILPISFNRSYNGVFTKIFFAITIYALYFALIVRSRYAISVGDFTYMQAISFPPLVAISSLIIFYFFEYSYAKSNRN